MFRSRASTRMGLINLVKDAIGGGKQDFLEADPFWDQSNIPINTCALPAVFFKGCSVRAARHGCGPCPVAQP